MKNLGKSLLAAAGLAAGVTAVASMSLPVTTAAYSFIGGSLPLTQRDFRVWNNYTDTQANNNTTPHANFPGQTGAVMAIWKGESEWASGPIAGNGLGDGLSATNPIIGSGGANFDTQFQGTATSQGNNTNIHAELNGNGGTTLAFTQSPIADGWTIKYYSSWTWQDGPGSVSSGVDMQGVACHEIGHSLGLGHTNTGGATMYPSISGTGAAQRSIEADDIAGVQAIYGVKSASKPNITGIGGTKQIGAPLTLTGSNFSTNNNEVWFTKAQVSDGVPVKVLSVSSTGGGTSITVTIPAGIQDGEVLVKNDGGSGGANLSNAWPLDIGAQGGNPPALTNIAPPQGPTGGYTPVTITGTGLLGTTSVKFGLVEAISYTVDSDAQISAISPPGPFFTLVDVTVTDNEGSDTLTGAFFYLANPAPSISAVSPPTGPFTGGALVEVSGSSVVGVTSVTFDGVAGTDLEIVSQTQLTVVTPAGALGPADVTATGSGSSTLPGGYTYVDQGSFTAFGTGKAGIFGVPLLSGAGDLTAGSLTGFDLTTLNGSPSAPGAMFFSLGQAFLPFKGGTFYPIPILVQINVVTDIFGSIVVHTNMPIGTPSGLNIYAQSLIQDFWASFNITMSNGLTITTP